MANLIGEAFGAAAAVAKGMAVTMKEMMSPTVTENYPDEPPKLQERFRGVHVLQRDENGMEKCVACFLCAAACPANCIYIEAAENTENDTPRCTTSITTGASSAAIAWKPAPPMRSRTDTDLKWPVTTRRRWSKRKKICWPRFLRERTHRRFPRLLKLRGIKAHPIEGGIAHNGLSPVRLIGA
jgi:ferredoxin